MRQWTLLGIFKWVFIILKTIVVGQDWMVSISCIKPSSKEFENITNSSFLTLKGVVLLHECTSWVDFNFVPCHDLRFHLLESFKQVSKLLCNVLSLIITWIIHQSNFKKNKKIKLPRGTVNHLVTNFSSSTYWFIQYVVQHKRPGRNEFSFERSQKSSLRCDIILLSSSLNFHHTYVKDSPQYFMI